MPILPSARLLALFALMSPVLASAAIEISFVEPEKFTDANQRGTFGADQEVLDEIAAHLERLNKEYLKPGQVLKVEIQDVDLAGSFEPWQTHSASVRFMREGAGPRIRLRYSLSEYGNVPVSAEEVLSDRSYLKSGSGYSAGDTLRYEKALLDSWFKKRVVDALKKVKPLAMPQRDSKPAGWYRL